MDVPASNLAGLIPGAGFVGILCWFLVLVMRHYSSDRRSYVDEIAAIRDAHAKQLREIEERHAEQIRQLREHYDTRIKALQSEVDQLRRDLDQERRARWKAEDAAAVARREAGTPDKGASDVE